MTMNILACGNRITYVSSMKGAGSFFYGFMLAMVLQWAERTSMIGEESG